MTWAVSDLRWRIRHIGQQKSKNMKKSLFILLISSMLLLNAKCGRDDCEFVPGGKKFNVFVPITYSPMQEKFRVGDTLTVEIQVPAVMEDTLTSEPLPIGDVVFDDVWGGDIGGVIVRIIKTQQDSTTWIYVANEFDYVQHSGKLHFTGGALSSFAVTFSSDTEKNRVAKFQMVPRRSGIYQLGFGSPVLNVTDQIGQYCSAQLFFYFGGQVAHNYHLLEDFDETKIGTYEQNRGSFIFIVEE